MASADLLRRGSAAEVLCTEVIGRGTALAAGNNFAKGLEEVGEAVLRGGGGGCVGDEG